VLAALASFMGAQTWFQAARFASQTASQSVQHPAIVCVHLLTWRPPAAALSCVPEITETEAVKPCTQQPASGFGNSGAYQRHLDGCRGCAKVSNELSNYRGADQQPPLDDPGSFGAAGIGIDARLACFTPKRSLVRTQYRPLLRP
jgi:hypothetical protein